MKNDTEHFLTVDETARVLKLSPRTVKTLLASEELPACRIGRSVRIHVDSLLTWILESGNAAQRKILADSGLFKQELRESEWKVGK